MRSAAHVDALHHVFNGLADPITSSAIISAKIGITIDILQEYNLRLGGNHQFQAWLASAQSTNRFVVRSVNDAPSALKNLPAKAIAYGVASYYSGSNIFVAPDSPFLAVTHALEAIGITVNCAARPIAGSLSGDNPVASLSLRNGGQADFEVLDKYFKPEENIIIYDKYIDEAGLELIGHIAGLLSRGSKIQIFTTTLGAKCLKPNAISARVKAINPDVTISCEEVSVDFRRLTHDRYIFCGKRLQLVFTAGIGVFGKRGATGKRKNKESTINIYAVDGENQTIIETACGKQLEVSCVDHGHL